MKSVDENQLAGQPLTANQLSGGTCTPLILAPNGKPYYPCGLIANSLFNDTFSQPVLLNAAGSSSANVTYNMTTQGIAWSSEMQRFKQTQYQPEDVEPPPNWQYAFPDGYNATNFPDLSVMYNLQNWMKTAGLPTFSKLALRNDNEAMRAGTYEIRVGDCKGSDFVGPKLLN